MTQRWFVLARVLEVSAVAFVQNGIGFASRPPGNGRQVLQACPAFGTSSPRFIEDHAATPSSAAPITRI